jgi:hypothetical protein
MKKVSLRPGEARVSKLMETTFTSPKILSTQIPTTTMTPGHVTHLTGEAPQILVLQLIQTTLKTHLIMETRTIITTTMGTRKHTETSSKQAAKPGTMATTTQASLAPKTTTTGEALTITTEARTLATTHTAATPSKTLTTQLTVEATMDTSMIIRMASRQAIHSTHQPILTLGTTIKLFITKTKVTTSHRITSIQILVLTRMPMICTARMTLITEQGATMTRSRFQPPLMTVKTGMPSHGTETSIGTTPMKQDARALMATPMGKALRPDHQEGRSQSRTTHILRIVQAVLTIR